MQALTQLLEAWFAANARDLQWRRDKTPYRVWLSEVMLQQTQVAVVQDYYARFLQRFPTVHDLAAASEDDVLAMWSGLGYYSRGRNLHKAARMVVSDFGGEFPSNLTQLQQLAGVGSYTAGAIAAFAFGQAAPVVDGNVARVLSRVYDDATSINTPAGKKHFEAMSLQLATASQNPGKAQEAVMELGATVCTPKNPRCDVCPLQHNCAAWAHGTIAQRPVKEAKRARTELHVACAVVVHGRKVWLQKNAEARLFGGLYQTPHFVVANGADPRDTMRQFTFIAENCHSGPDPESNSKTWTPDHTISGTRVRGDTSLNIPDPIVVKRVLTHRDLWLHGFLFSRGEIIPPPHALFSASELSTIGVSNAMMALLKQSLPSEFWHA